MNAQPSLVAIVLLGMGVVFVFLVFLSAMMAALTAVAGRRAATPAGSPPPVAEPAGPGSPGWIVAATAVFLAAEQTAARLPSAAAWRPYDTADAVRWRLGAAPAYRGRVSERPAAP